MKLSPGQKHFMSWLNTYCGGIVTGIKLGNAALGCVRKGLIAVDKDTVTMTEKGKSALREIGLRVDEDDQCT